MQSLPLEAKVRMTEARIKAWHEHWGGDVYISFSGGKDSTVLKHIADSLYPSIPSVFVNTGLEYPEVRSFALRQKNVIRLDPAMRFYDVIEKYGYPVVSKEQSQFLYEARTTKSEKLLGIRLNGNRWGKGKISEKWKFLIDAPFKISNKCCDVMKKAPVKNYGGRELPPKILVAEVRMQRLHEISSDLSADELLDGTRRASLRRREQVRDCVGVRRGQGE